MQDTTKHQGLRRQLIASLRDKGIRNGAVLKAMEAIPRHLFMDPGLVNFAYEDMPIRLQLIKQFHSHTL